MPRTIDYDDYSLEIDDYEPRHRPENQTLVRGVPVNPTLREAFDCTPNEERDPLEIEDWWDRPYVVSYEKDSPEFRKRWPEGVRYDVRCLDGGAWDRSTNRGAFPSLDAAVDHALALAAQEPEIWNVSDLSGNILYEGTRRECEEWVQDAHDGRPLVFVPPAAKEK